MSDKDDGGPLGAALAGWDQLFRERELGAGHWSAADLHALVIATMKHDAQLICDHCAKDVPVYRDRHGQSHPWLHNGSTTGSSMSRCPASSIHEVIAQMEKARQ